MKSVNRFLQSSSLLLFISFVTHLIHLYTPSWVTVEEEVNNQVLDITHYYTSPVYIWWGSEYRECSEWPPELHYSSLIIHFTDYSSLHSLLHSLFNFIWCCRYTLNEGVSLVSAQGVLIYIIIHLYFISLIFFILFTCTMFLFIFICFLQSSRSVIKLKEFSFTRLFISLVVQRLIHVFTLLPLLCTYP